MPQEISSEDFERGYPRTTGLLIAVIGAGLLYWLAWLPVHDALSHAARVEISGKGTVVGTALVLLGLVKMVFGSAATPFLKPEGDESKLPAIMLIVVVLAAGFGAHYTLRNYFKTQGYALRSYNAPIAHIRSTEQDVDESNSSR